MATQRIFISYRRSDSGTVVARLYDVLAAVFGPDNVFRDVASIGAGTRFDDAVEKSIQRCSVFLAVIESLYRLRIALDEVRLRKQVREDWGIDRDGSGDAMTVAFWGPAGCGKTLAARVFAHELDLELYQINLEEAFLRWNLGDRLPIDWLLRRTVATPVVLQMRDTTGAFSGAPGGSTESRLVAASLLRQLEERDGLTIVTSRSPVGRDHASGSRFDHIVELPFPDGEARRIIWQRCFPPELPAEAIDFESLARHPLSGMSIRRIVKRAALRAAREGTPVQMIYVEEALRLDLPATS
ncbi:MAG TPA: AAA family ATPase [Thermoanaerobaculia bacterium]|nr:AAA family ATPase [Thermoanaerobaculia bacterium]